VTNGFEVTAVYIMGLSPASEALRLRSTPNKRVTIDRLRS
jgi:hypothetical protein